MFKQSQFKFLTLFFSSLFLASCMSSGPKTSQNQAHVRPQSLQQNTEITSASVVSDQKIRQELTGKNEVSFPSSEQLKKEPLSVQHFYAGKRAAAQKNYILSIKHYNTVIKKYPRSAQVKPALLAKAQVYKEMGLIEPAQLNLRLALKKTVSSSKKQTAKTKETQKITK